MLDRKRKRSHCCEARFNNSPGWLRIPYTVNIVELLTYSRLVRRKGQQSQALRYMSMIWDVWKQMEISEQLYHSVIKYASFCKLFKSVLINSFD